MKNEMQDALNELQQGGVGVLPTDTIYGLVGSALLSETVERIYELRRRDPKKPMIVLISGIQDLEQFGIVLSAKLIEQLKKYWPGPYSIILPTIDEQFEYLHRGSDRIAFRVPDKPELLLLLEQTGPLVAPSANMEGMPPARTIPEARRYFGTDIEFYIDEGELDQKASTLLEIDGDAVRIIRE